jgi:Ca2+-binding RTX toxin-like protein
MAEILVGGVHVYDAAPSLQGASAVPTATDAVQLVRLGAFTGTGDVAAGRAESVDFDAHADNLYITNLAAGRIDIAHLDSSGQATASGGFDLTALPAYGGVNSVAVKGGIVAVAYGNADPAQAGYVALYDAATGTLQKVIQAGVLPDQITFSPDGEKILVANEGEAISSTNNPQGSVSIIDVSHGAANATVSNTISFAALNGSEAVLKAQGLALFPGQAAANDIEPEYITVSPDGTRAYVTLQEVNAVAVIDLTNPAADRPMAIQPLGGIDRLLDGNQFDPNDQNGISFVNADVVSLQQPDAIASFTVGGATYFITANEGDARVGAGLVDEARLSANGVKLDPTAYPDGKPAALSRLNVITSAGDTDNDGDIDQITTFGGRGVSIFRQNADGSITKVRETGGEFERIIAQINPSLHNTENGASPDNRSDNKGPEPEGVTVGAVGGRLYAFVSLERVGGVMIYDVTDPANADFVGYKPATSEDFAPEVVKFVSAADSPSGQALFITANEVSGTTTIYTVVNQSAGNDSIQGGPDDDHLLGRAGSDTIVGFGGDDTLEGGAGADLMKGGPGDDTYVVDNVGDKIEEAGNGGTDTVVTNLAGYKLGSAIENLTLTGTANLSATGHSGNNVLTGNDGANLLDGGSGNDTLIGGVGTDTLQGGAGNDSLAGGAEGDRLLGDGGDDTLSGGEGGDTLDGGGQSDALSGGAGADSLSGGGQNDRLNGGAGNDILSGGGQNDVFVFTVGSGADVVVDFNVRFDALDLTGQTVTSYGSVGGDALISFDDGGSVRLVGVSLDAYLNV